MSDEDTILEECGCEGGLRWTDNGWVVCECSATEHPGYVEHDCAVTPIGPPHPGWPGEL